MVFWGIEVKPGKPYTHSSKDGRGRLRISQATLAIGNAALKSLVQCNVGDKRPVLLCALLPNKTESLQLDLEFDEGEEDVIFSVVGPRGVYLTGYYVSHNRQSIIQDDSESYGEDIANSESNHCSDDEDEYDDSFINDDEPEPLTPSPVSSIRDDDEGDLLKMKKKQNLNDGHKRLKKRYQTVESDDDDMNVPEIDEDNDILVSSICKSQTSGKKSNKETTAEVDKKTVNSCVLASKDTVDLLPETKSKTKKKRRDSSKDYQKPDDTRGVDRSLEVLISAEKNLKVKKKRKGCNEVNTDATDNNQENDQQAIDKISELANGNGSEEKKVKKKRRKTQEQEVEVEVEEKENKSYKKKTLSSGLVIEDLVTGGNSKGKVATAGRKVKVQYVVKLKENGQMIDSNGKSPYKFRLGDKEVIDGLNVGLDGMRVGDRRRLTIPPSMSLGYKGTGENVPPNSWLLYDVEMTSIH